MSERTLWLGIRAEAKHKMGEYAVRIGGIRQQLRTVLVPSEPGEIDANLIYTLAVDLRASRIEYDEAAARYREACRELGEPC